MTLYDSCGFLGFFKKEASDDTIKTGANALGVCDKGTAWDEDKKTCIAVSSNAPVEKGTAFMPAASFARDGTCKCSDQWDTLVDVRSKEECDVHKFNGSSCAWISNH